jgi:hypothetical protein
MGILAHQKSTELINLGIKTRIDYCDGAAK